MSLIESNELIERIHELEKKTYLFETTKNKIIKEIKAMSSNPIPIGELLKGTRIKIGDIDFIVLEQNVNTTLVITAKAQYNIPFGLNYDYIKSGVRKYCINDFYNSLSEKIGIRNIRPQTFSLEADDGTGKDIRCCDPVFILTNNDYRYYRDFLPTMPERTGMWSATPITYNVEISQGGYEMINYYFSSEKIFYYANSLDNRQVYPCCCINSDVKGEIVE